MSNKITDFTNYTVNVPHQAAWLVYINGIEVPVVQVDVSFGVWNIPEATLQMVPHVILQRIGFEDRLQVQIFYLDEFYEAANPEFRLLHEYEVIGWGYTNTGTGRFIQLNCRSHLQIMEQLYFYYMSAVDDMVVANSPATASDAGIYSDSMVYYPYSLFSQGLVKPVPLDDGVPDTTVTADEFVRSPFEFVSNVFRALLAPIDVASPDNTAEPGKLPANAASCPGRNFFGRWLNMTDFRRRWAGLPYFDDDQAKSIEGCFPLIKAVEATEALTAVQQQIGESIGHAGSMWDLLKYIFGVMYYEVLAVPAPPAVKLKKGTGLLEGPIDSGESGTVRNASQSFGGILSNMVKPQCIFGIPPTCNIIFPSMLSNYSFQENYLNQPTRVYLGERFLTNVLSAASNGSVAPLTSEAVTTGYPLVVQNRMRLYISDPKQNTKNFLIFPEELFKGPVTRRMNAPPWLYMLSKMTDAEAAGSSYFSNADGATATEGTTVAGGFSSEAARQASGPPRRMPRKQVVQRLKPIVAKYADKVSIPRAMVFAMIQKESGFNPNAVAWDGGHGLMQIQAAGTWDRGKGSKKTVDTTAFAWRLAKSKFGGPKTMPGSIYNLDNNVKMGVALMHHYMISRQVKVTGVKPNLNDITDIGTIRGILAFKFGASNNSLIWKFDYDATNDIVILNKGKNKGKEYASATKSLHRFRKALLKWQQRDLNPTPATAPVTDPDIAAEHPQDTSEQPGTQHSEDTATVVTEAPGVEQNVQNDLEALIGSEYQSKLGSLFNVYARYEFYRTRFEQRSGGVSLSFNPYIVPGFPAVVFDEKSSGFDVIGYVTNVSHTMNAQGDAAQLATHVGMTYMRSFPEFIRYLKQGFEEAGYVGDTADFDCGPTEPIPSVGEAFQIEANADTFFKEVFYPGITKTTTSGWSPSFHWREMIVAYDVEGNEIKGEEDFNLEDGLITQPTRQYFREFRSYDAAMAYVARPACTLRQYVELRHGKPLSQLISEGYIKGQTHTYWASTRDKGRGKAKGGATYWARIDSYVQGPGNPSSEVIERITNVGPAQEFAPPASGSWDIITASTGIPQTRQNWDKMLSTYRRIVLGEVSKGANPLRYVAPQV